MRRFDFYAKRQAGGTVTGLIVGLIIGLSIAVVVGLTIMKMPLPFVDRLGKQSEPAGELGDPNKTMPGGARERRERLADEDAGADATSPATGVAAKKLPEPLPEPAATIESVIKSRTAATERAASEKNVATPTAPPPPTPSSSPTAATAATPSTAAANDEKFTYYLQAGAFREIADAENTKAKLALLGVAATVAERRSELGSLFRVRIGPFTEVEAMNRARSRLSDNGVDAAVVRVPK
jgi:cell division protein FtsN